MTKKYYLLLTLTIIASITIYSVNTYAATSNVTGTVTDSSTGISITLTAQSFTNVNPETLSADDTDTYATYKITHNLRLTGFEAGKYYTGILYYRITTTPNNNPPLSNLQKTETKLINNSGNEGIKSFIATTATNWYQILVILDNYIPETTETADAGNVELTYTGKGSLNLADYTMNFTTSITAVGGGAHIDKSDIALNDRLSAIIYNAVNQGTIQGFTDVLEALTLIRQNDANYYSTIISKLTTMQSYSQEISSRLLTLNENMVLKFEDVQTILDLFPSYRTQVLEYWQQLLEMNATQSQQAQENASQYADKENTSATLLSGLNSLQMPDIENQNFNILAPVDTDTKTNLFGMIGTITHIPIVTQIMLIIVTAAIVGIILYGKK